MGQQLSRDDFDPLPLRKGVKKATFQSSGIKPGERQRLDKSVKQSYNSDAQSLNTRVWFLTNPAADEERKSLINLNRTELDKIKS